VAQEDPSVRPAERMPLNQQALALVSQSIINTSESIIVATRGASVNNRFVITSSALKLAQFHQKSINVIDVQNLANPKHTRQPV
jgi:hypothetical protein